MAEKPLRVKSPLTDADVKRLKAGMSVLITGVIYVGRDAAHRRIIETLDRGEKPPFDVRGQTIYYMGPSPARPGQVIGSAGPTTSSRMDVFTPRLLEAGLKTMIGKGERSMAVREAIVKYKAVYFVATGGAAALITKSIKKSETVAYAELGAEALLRIEVEDFPAIVANDMYGGDIFEQAKAKYRRGG
jgi:fumarate hydratase subunit beta